MASNKELRNQVNNLCCRMAISHVELYISADYPHNIYLIQPFFGSPSLVLGREVRKCLSPSEMESILMLNLQIIKKETGYLKMSLGLILSFIYSPLSFVKLSPLKSFTSLRDFFVIFFLPITTVREFFHKKVNYESYVTGELTPNEKRNLDSAFFKISILKAKRRSLFGQLIFNELAIIDNRESNFLLELLRRRKA